MPNSQEQLVRPLHEQFRPRRRVVFIDKAAESIITLGGLAVLAAVLGIMAYLLWVVYPLTQPGKVESTKQVAIDSDPSFVLIDEYERLVTIAEPTGQLRSLSLDSGEMIPEAIDLGPFESAMYSPSTGLLAFARADSSVEVGSLSHQTAILRRSNLESGLPSLEIGEVLTIADGVLERTGEDQYRKITLSYKEAGLIEATEIPSKIIAIDAEEFGRDKVVAAMYADGTGSVMIMTARRSLVGNSGDVKVRTLAIVRADSSEIPAWVTLLDSGNDLVLIFPDGRADRYARGNSSYEFAESVQLIDADAKVASVLPLLGRNSILIGTSLGEVRTWMLTRGDSAGGDRTLVNVRNFQIGQSPITRLATSLRDRTFIASDTQGQIRLWHATSGKLVGMAQGPDTAKAVVISPKLDGFLSIGNNGISSWHLEPGHPTVTLESLFLPVWYEGDQSPSLVYQSTAADDSAEPKLSLTPLIFGTLKATVFAMLFAVPIAVMAAVYSSEFLSKRLRTKVKPAIEMMASLPSVVLGFIAAMILAPFVRDHLSAVLVGFVVVPIAVLLVSGVWPLLPGNLAWRLPQSVQLGFMLLACLIGIGVSAAVGPVIDRGMFSLNSAEEAVLAGQVEPATEIPEWAESKQSFTLSERNRLRAEGLFVQNDRVVTPVRDNIEIASASVHSPLKVWLTGTIGSPVPGWVAVLFVPSLAIAGLLAMSIRRQSAARWMPLTRVAVSIAIAVPLAFVLARICVALGWDARESILGTFTQRNTFVVGVIMGFAIIPIIFTLSDDAMQSVPNALRAASLGAGATQWQTAMRIVFPVAASGIFSAIMIGLGRAAGETMIVLMATGNTPVMDWNIFGGLRTLSANIAVELPEADRGGTHYRVLFLCGVVLFAITFVVNTSAEIVRQHFRKRSALL